MPLTHPERRERRLRMAAAVRNGASIADVCTEYGVSDSTVYGACQSEGVGVLRWARQSIYVVLAELLNTKDSFAEIAKRHGVTRQAIHNVASKARRAGIQVHSRGR